MRTFFLLVWACCLAGCSPAIPTAYLKSVDRSLSYPEVKANIERYLGATVMWGGYVQQTRNTPEGTYIEIIESPLDSRHRPVDMDQTRGRFLFLVPGFAEPVQFAQGRAITVVGEVRGAQELPVGETRYTYPVVLRRFHTFWKPKTRPDVHLGVGVGTVF